MRSPAPAATTASGDGAWAWAAALSRFVTAPRRRWELPVAIVLVLGLTAAFAWQSYFFADDLFFPAYFREFPFGVDSLTRSWFGHLMPAYAASIAGFLAVFGLSWPAAAVIIGVIHAGAFTALVRIVDAVTGARRMALLAGLAFSLSLGPIALRLWWAASLNNTVALAVSLAAFGCLTRFVVGTRWTRWGSLAAGLVLYALALASSEKSLLFSMHLFLWCVLVIWRGRPVLERVKSVLRSWPVWVGVIVISLAELYLYLGGPYLAESDGSPSGSTTVRFMLHSALGGLVPSLFGFDLVYAPVTLLNPVIIVTCLLFAAFVVTTVVVKRSNAGVWLFTVVVVLANTFVLSRRADVIGIGAGRELRYHLENTALLWAAIGVVVVSTLLELRRRADARAGLAASASAPGSGSAAATLPGGRRTGRLIASVVAALAVAGLVAVSAVAWVGSFDRIVTANPGPKARAWVETMERTLPADPPPLIDSPLPEPVALASLYPYNMTSAMLPVFGREVAFTSSLEGAWVVGADGTAGPATLDAVKAASDGAACTDGNGDLEYPGTKADKGRYLVIDYSAAAGDSFAVFAGNRWTEVERPAGAGTVVLYLPYGIAPGELAIGAQSSPVCIDGLSIADVVPAR
ncbi:hypothetical protein SCB71_14900 [Herbiconiux sp. KACC 21604]|uniref:hypothetical protein n=1 Tax=unclassified Herbiconiux TaxID=2618217 RepID=UPI00149274FB|nr:hypothetical protein [Herbiconiux sp. SALV-R1]QJU54426.1 hypothetical protein HL652_12840 [Herbiconiux sp. SALV-R1]WPO85501.1 hypothetical protein SCB71_14900 [Herbiconiux sp. KACC 21604]